MLFWSCKKWVCTYVSVCVRVHYLYRKIMDHMHAMISTTAISEVQDYVFYSICSLIFFLFFFFLTVELIHFERELETWNPCWLKSCVRIWLMKCLLIPYRPYNLNPWLRIGTKELNVFGDTCKYKAVFSVWRKIAEKDIRITARLLREIAITSDIQMPWPLWQKAKN